MAIDRSVNRPARGSLDVQALAGGGGAAPQTPHGNGSSGVGEGFRWEGDDPVQLAKGIEAAFDYRGDVTLVLD